MAGLEALDGRPGTGFAPAGNSIFKHLVTNRRLYMGDWDLRGREFLDENFYLALGVAVVLVLLGGWLVFTTTVSPGTVTETRQVTTWEATGEYDHEAEVQEPNRVFPTGTVLRERSVYYTRITPELRGGFRFGYGATDGELEVDVETTLVVHAVGDEGEEFWRIERPLDSTSTSLSPGETATTEFGVNVSAVLQEIAAVESELGASPGQTRVEVQSLVRAQGTAAGEPVSHRRRYAMTVDPGEATYTTEGDEARTDSGQRVEEVTRPRSYGLGRQLLGPLLLVGGLAGVGGLVVGRRREYFEISEVERVRKDFAVRREEFDDWISRGTIPEAARDRPEIRIEDLEDIVDVAIDSETRVIEDVDDERYYALADGFCYTYEPPEILGLER